MLARPTTDQIILDCRNELLNTISPAVEAPQAKIAIQMMENVLRNSATRALHEIGWMQEEIDAMIAFAGTVAAAPCSTPAVAAALSGLHRSTIAESPPCRYHRQLRPGEPMPVGCTGSDNGRRRWCPSQCGPRHPRCSTRPRERDHG